MQELTVAKIKEITKKGIAYTKRSRRIQHIKEWWWAYFLGAIAVSFLIDWWRSLDFSYGSPDCAIPILGSWLIVIAIWIPIIIGISNAEDE